MALRDQPYIPLYVQDFMTDEKLSECSAESTGVYIRVMCIMHKSQEYGTVLLKQKYKQNPSKIKNFAVKLHRLMPYSIDVIERSLAELVDEEVLTIEGDVLIQRRMVKDGNLSLIRANAGSKGGKIAQGKSVAGSFAKAKSKAKEQAKEQANTEYEYEYENEVKGTKKRMTYDDPGFQVFWSAYPKKVGKPAAEKAFARLKTDQAMLDLMLEAIAIQKRSRQWQDTQYIPHPTTWLNQRRWEDKAEKTSAGYGGKKVSAQMYEQRNYTDDDYKPDIDWLEVARRESEEESA